MRINSETTNLTKNWWDFLDRISIIARSLPAQDMEKMRPYSYSPYGIWSHDSSVRVAEHSRLRNILRGHFDLHDYDV
jgi:hypothetical protein